MNFNNLINRSHTLFTVAVLLASSVAEANLILFPTLPAGSISVADQAAADLDRNSGAIELMTPGSALPVGAGGMGGATFTGHLNGRVGKVGLSFPGINIIGSITAGDNGYDTGAGGILFGSLDYVRGLDLGLSSITELATTFSGKLYNASGEPGAVLAGGERFGLGAYATTFTSQPGDIARSFWVDPGNTQGKTSVDPLIPNTSPTILSGVYKPGNGILYLMANIKLGPNERIDLGKANGPLCDLDDCSDFVHVVPEPSAIALLAGGLIAMLATRRRRHLHASVSHEDSAV